MISSEAGPPRAGIYLAHKQRGETSFSLVRALMEEVRLSRIRKLPVCHGGALDPFAEGLVLLLAGPTVAEGDRSALTPALLDAALAPLLGFTGQVPPAFSNKRVEGERAYLKAHRGEEVVLPPSRVYLHEARFVAHQLPRSSTLLLTCAGGYYVRALARDLGRALGCRAHLSALRRTAIGPWLDPGPASMVAPGEWPRIEGEALLPWLPSRLVTDREEKLVAMEKPIGPGPLRPPEWPLPAGFPAPPRVRALHRSKLVGILGPDGATLLRLRPT